jgi:hypothetical protein
VTATVILSDPAWTHASAASPAGEARPAVQGSASDRTAVRAPEQSGLDAVSEVERGVGVWVAATRWLGALGAPQVHAGAAPSAIPPSRLVLHRPVAVPVEVLGEGPRRAHQRGDRRAILSAMGIEPDGDDHVAPPLQTPLHPSGVVRFDRVGVRTHPWMPFGTPARVTDPANGRTVTVVINDRGPFGLRIIDPSRDVLAPPRRGVCGVRLAR